MASTGRFCCGTASGSGISGIRTFGSSAQPFYPSNGVEAGDLQATTLELFWYVHTAPSNGRWLFAVRDLSNGTIFEGRWTSSNDLRIIFRDQANNSKTITISNVTGGTVQLNVWYHLVVYANPSQLPSPLWVAAVGRVGIDVSGNPSTADTFPSSYTVAAATMSGTSPNFLDSFRGMRNNFGDATRIFIGGDFNTSGTPISGRQNPGGVAEFRLWRIGPDTSPRYSLTGPDSIADLRDQFIDSTQFPDLIHCFRLNEEDTTDPLDFDDVGYKDARFVSAVLNPNFASSPMPNSTFFIPTRVGSYIVATFPDAITRNGSYIVSRTFTPLRDGAYKVRNITTPERDGEYKVNAPFTADRPGSYNVNSETTFFRNGAYVVQIAEVADQIQRIGEYRVQTTPELSREGEYVIGQIPTIERDGEYHVLIAIGTESRTGVYRIITFPTAPERTGAYKVSVPATLSRSGEYRIAGQTDDVTIRRRGTYYVYNPDFTATLVLRKQAELRSRTRG